MAKTIHGPFRIIGAKDEVCEECHEEMNVLVILDGRLVRHTWCEDCIKIVVDRCGKSMRRVK